jgi:dUTP pyrophosphatase
MSELFVSDFNDIQANPLTGSVTTAPTFAKPKYQLNIKVCSTEPDVVNFYKNFTSHHLGDSGIDLYNFETLAVGHFEVGTIDFKIQCEMINLKTNEYCSYYLYPRSSLSKTCFQLANSVGIIDAGYRGSIMAKVRCFETDSRKPGILYPGSYFQITAPDLEPIKVQVVESLSSTTRNDGGFGSTNSK